MRHALALGVLPAMVPWSRPASAETTVLLYLGVSFTHDWACLGSTASATPSWTWTYPAARWGWR